MKIVIDIDTEHISEDLAMYYADLVETVLKELTTDYKDDATFDNGLTPIQNYFILEVYRSHFIQALAESETTNETPALTVFYAVRYINKLLQYLLHTYGELT